MRSSIETIARSELSYDLIQKICSNRMFKIPNEGNPRLEEKMNVFVRSERFDITELDLESLRLVIWSLKSSVADSIGGLIIGDAIAGGSTSMEDIAAELETDNSVYTILLRLLMVKRPTSNELLDWMIDRRDRILSEAANCIVTDASPSSIEIEPIRALLLAVVHSSMDLQELVVYLMNEETKIRSIRLIGAYLGDSGIRRRVLMR